MGLYIKTYNELSRLITFEDRYNYLKLNGSIGEDTFGFDRYLNQNFYRSKEWKDLRQKIILRDNGCDLGIEGYEIFSRPIIHHINPMTIDDIVNGNPMVFDPNNLITTSISTHNAIHYGTIEKIGNSFVERSKDDTTLWRKR